MATINFNDIGVITRSYHGDFPMLPFLYKSIEKNFPSVGSVVLVVEPIDYEKAKSIVPSWVRVAVEESFAPGSIQHKYTKLAADLHISEDYVFHIDSDSIITQPLSIDDLFNEGRPYLDVVPYAHLLEYQDSIAFRDYMIAYVKQNHLKAEIVKDLEKIGVVGEIRIANWMAQNYDTWILDNFDRWFENWFRQWKSNFGMDIWRAGTESAIGHPVLFEFSQKPQKIYPRGLYATARLILEKNFNCDVKEFIKTRVGRQTAGVNKSSYFSDLNFLGAVLWSHFNDQIHWVDVSVLGLEYSSNKIKQFISYDVIDSATGCLRQTYLDEVAGYLGEQK